LYFARGKWFVKAINGTTHLESMTLHPYLRDAEGKPPKRYTSTGTRKVESIQPMDLKRKLSREVCIFRLGDSDRRFWITGTLPLKEGEVEENAPGEERKEKRREKGDRHEKDRGETRRERERGEKRVSRSRSGRLCYSGELQPSR